MNDGVYGSFNCIHFDHARPIIRPFSERDSAFYRSKVFGPTCDSMDTIAQEVHLPELAVGEWCFVECFGAYTTAAASDFNGFRKTPAFYVLRGDTGNNPRTG
jgi:ornithine decarboxylase